MRTRQSLSDLIEGRLSSPDARAEHQTDDGAGPGYRNGVRTGRLKTAEGLVDYAAPRIAGRDEPFRRKIREQLKGRSQAPEDLAVEFLTRGLSVRDIKDAFKRDGAAVAIEDGGLMSRLRLPSVFGGGLMTGETQEAEIDLSPGAYVYTCPLNTTPDNRLIVKE